MYTGCLSLSFKFSLPETTAAETKVHQMQEWKYQIQIDLMVFIIDAHFTMRTHGVNQAFRFVEGIWLHRTSHQIRFFVRKKTLFTSFVRNVK